MCQTGVGHFIFEWIHQEIEVNLVNLQRKVGKVYKYIYLYFTFFPNWKKTNNFSWKELDCVRFVLTVFLKLFSHNSLLRFEIVLKGVNTDIYRHKSAKIGNIFILGVVNWLDTDKYWHRSAKVGNIFILGVVNWLNTDEFEKL